MTKQFTVDENHQGVYAYIKYNNEYIGKRCGKKNIYYICDLLNEQDQQIKELTNFKNKVFSILDEEIRYKKGLQGLSEEKSMDMSLEKFTFELEMLMTIKRKLKDIK